MHISNSLSTILKRPAFQLDCFLTCKHMSRVCLSLHFRLGFCASHFKNQLQKMKKKKKKKKTQISISPYNGKQSCIFIALFQSTDYSKCFTILATFTHTFIHWWQRVPCKAPTAYQEQFGVQYLAQGHLNMQLGGAGIQASDLFDY